MAGLWRISQKARRVRVNGKEYRYPARVVWRVFYRVWTPQGKFLERAKDSPNKGKAALLLSEAEKLEARSQRGLLTEADIRAFHAVGLLTAKHARLFLGYPPDLTWETLLEQYSTYSSTHCRPRTHRENMKRARKLVESFGARGVPPDQMSSNDIADWKVSRKRAGVQNKTVNLELDVLRKILDPIFSKQDNPARLVPKLDVSKMGRLPRALTPDEDEAALRLAWQRRHLLAGLFWPLYLVYRLGGLRRDEARLLTWPHVLEDRILVQEVKLASHEVAKGDDFSGGIWRPKEGDARAVPLPTWVMNELHSVPRSSRLVFSLNGRAFYPSSISLAFKKVLRKVAPDLNLHALRHTFVTEAMERGIPSARVQRLAGHKLLSTTERYTHVVVDGRIRDLECIYLQLRGGMARQLAGVLAHS
jgi:integrase